MATKRATRRSAKPAKEAHDHEEIILDLIQDKALRLVDKSAKVRAELEQAVSQAAARAVRKCMKDHKIDLTPAQATVLTSIWFRE